MFIHVHVRFAMVCDGSLWFAMELSLNQRFNQRFCGKQLPDSISGKTGLNQPVSLG